MNVLMLGAQGSGKGTQAKRISAEYGVPHIASGDMLRTAMAAETPVGLRVKPIYDAGLLVSDELMIDLFRERLTQRDAQDGFVLDGFPRTMAQAEALDGMLRDLNQELSIVFVLQLPEQVCVDRLSKRAREEGRADDTPEAIATRLALYHRETEPLVEHYRTSGNLVAIHADGTVEKVFAEIQEALEQVAARA